MFTFFNIFANLHSVSFTVGRTGYMAGFLSTDDIPGDHRKSSAIINFCVMIKTDEFLLIFLIKLF